MGGVLGMTLLALSAQASPGATRLSDYISRAFEHVTSDRRQRYTQRLHELLTLNISAGSPEGECESLVGRRLASLHVLSVKDRWRRKATQDSRYGSLVLPTEHYQRVSESAFKLLEYDLERGLDLDVLDRRPKAEAEEQLRLLMEDARQYLSGALIGEEAKTFVDGFVDETLEHALRSLESPFPTIGSALPASDFEELRSTLRDQFRGVTPVAYLTPKERSLASIMTSRLAHHSPEELEDIKQRKIIAESYVEMAESSIRSFIYSTTPERAPYALEYEQAFSEAQAWLQHAEAENAHLVDEVFAAASRKWREEWMGASPITDTEKADLLGPDGTQDRRIAGAAEPHPSIPTQPAGTPFESRGSNERQTRWIRLSVFILFTLIVVGFLGRVLRR